MDNTFIYKNDRPWPNARLKRAAIVGHTTGTSTRLWFRTASPGDYTVLIYAASDDPEDEVYQGFKSVPYQALDTLPGAVRALPFTVYDFRQDSTAVIDIDDLSPNTEYRYALYGSEQGIGRILIGQDRPYRFKTLSTTLEPFSFGFYSCHMPYKHSIFGGTDVVNMEMWGCLNTVLERHYAKDLRFVIAGGDQVYTDGVKTLDIWKYLNKVMGKKDGDLYPSTDIMVSWYRDIYRGYWGFPSVRQAFSSYPTYMIWDDHELGDGWGSFLLEKGKQDELDEIFPARKKKKLTRKQCLELLNRMRAAAFQVYQEYQHSHNPETPAGQFDYAIEQEGSAVYVLDGRGNRDINRDNKRILGQTQFKRFKAWLEGQDPESMPYIFIVSAVPVLHMKTVFVNADDNAMADMADLQDDLRDAWEHELHDAERKALVKLLFAAAKRGHRICILSGDVHTSAAFRLIDEKSGSVMYQLTSSAITYNKSRLMGWILGSTVPDDGKSPDGYRFERLALYTESNFSLVKVDPNADQVIFQLYGRQKVQHPGGEKEDRPMTHSLAKLELKFK